MIGRREIYDLDDRRLVTAMALIESRAAALELPLTPWELGFARGIVERYKMSPRVSWKQRREMRRILEKTAEALEHRAAFTSELRAALLQAGGEP